MITTVNAAMAAAQLAAVGHLSKHPDLPDVSHIEAQWHYVRECASIRVQLNGHSARFSPLAAAMAWAESFTDPEITVTRYVGYVSLDVAAQLSTGHEVIVWTHPWGAEKDALLAKVWTPDLGEPVAVELDVLRRIVDASQAVSA